MARGPHGRRSVRWVLRMHDRHERVTGELAIAVHISLEYAEVFVTPQSLHLHAKLCENGKSGDEELELAHTHNHSDSSAVAVLIGLVAEASRDGLPDVFDRNCRGHPTFRHEEPMGANLKPACGLVGFPGHELFHGADRGAVRDEIFDGRKTHGSLTRLTRSA